MFVYTARCITGDISKRNLYMWRHLSSADLGIILLGGGDELCSKSKQAEEIGQKRPAPNIDST